MKLPSKMRLEFRKGTISDTRKAAACGAVWDLLSLYADGETSRDETAMVESHIAVCHDCAQDLAFMRSTTVVFSMLPEVAPPIGLRSAILMATVEKPTKARRFAEAFNRFTEPQAARYGMAAAAGLAGLLFAVAINRGLNPAEILENPAVYRPAPRMADNKPAPSVSPRVRDLAAPSTGIRSHPEIRTAPLAQTDPVVRALPATSARTDRVASGGRAAVIAATHNRKSGVKPTVGIPAPSPAFAGGEMKVKPIIGPMPLPTEEGAAHTADMVVMGDPVPMNPATPPVVMPDPRPAESTAAAPTPRLHRIQLTSSVTPESARQIATFAELKRALKHRDLDGARAIEESIKAGEIRVPVLKKTF